ncbi:serine hydrolase [Candidatus Saccharibacteria bacterium]|nr:serine hydrolase [Candidatus Saccharibacteria bacterium]
MYPNDPNQPQPPQQPPQPNQGWGPSPQYQEQPQQQQPAQQYPQQPYVQQPQFGQPAQPQAPQPPQQPSYDYQVVPQPMAAPKKLPGSRGPLSLLFNDWMKQHWRLTLLIITGIILLGFVIFQIVYPNTRLLPGAQIDGAAVGGMRKDEAAEKLNKLYGEVEVSIYFGKNDAAFMKSKLKDMGISVVNNDRVAQMNYPFYLKLIPTSIFWANSLIKPGALEYAYDKEKIQSYTEGKVGDTCTIPAKDATLKLIDSQLQVVPSIAGGECDITEFQRVLAEAKPVSGASATELRIDSTETPAAVDDDKARELADTLNKRMKDPMPISLGSNSESVPGRIVLGWLDFKSDVPEASIDTANQTAKLAFTVNGDRMSTYLNDGIASKVVKKAGVSKVSTLDFTETSRVNGAGGQELDMARITASVTDYINAKVNQAVAVTHAVGPTVIYTRSYTPTSVGYSALLSQFAQDNPGKYGLSITEVSGVTYPRSATYNGDTRFTSAGVESIYLGYAVTMERYSGALRPVEQIAGSRNVEKCLKDMYERGDEQCRTGFYTRLGFNTVTQRGTELGLKNTVFANKGGVTSANDLHNVMVGFAKNQIARVEGGASLLTMTRANRSNDGIAAGITSAGSSVAHVTGENETMLNDSAVIYSNKGVYVLTVISEGSSWDKIAELTKKIEAFKQVKIPKDAR